MLVLGKLACKRALVVHSKPVQEQALGSKQAPVLELDSKQELVQALGSRPVLVQELALGSKQVLVQEQALGNKQVLEQELGNKQVLELELGNKQELVPELGSKPELVLGSIALQACSIAVYACSSHQKVQLVPELLKIRSKRSSLGARKICSSRSPKCLSCKKDLYPPYERKSIR